LSAGPRREDAAAFNKQAKAEAARGDHRAAVESYRKALAIHEALGEAFEEAIILHNIGSSYWSVGDNAPALEYYARALAIRERIGDKPGLAYTHYGIALVHWTWGDAESALESYDRALGFWRELKNAAGEADVLNSTGLALVALGEPVRALDRYQRSLELWVKLGNKTGEAYTRNNMGMLHAAARRHGAAQAEYEAAAALLREAGDERGIAYVRHNVGDLHQARGGFVQAVEAYEDSLARKTKLDDRYGMAVTLTRLGEVHAGMGRREEEAAYLRRGLALQKATGNRTGEAATLAALARVERDADLAAQAVDLSERTRAAISNDELRVNYFATQRDLYSTLINLQVEGKNLEGALETSERSRARVLLDVLTAGRGSPSTEQRELQRRIHALSQRRALKELDERLHEWAAMEAQARRADADLSPDPMKTRELREGLLKGETALLEYFSGEKNGHAFLLTKAGLWHSPLPGRAELDGMVRACRKALTARSDRSEGESVEARSRRISLNDARSETESRTLARLLIEPFAAQLAVKKILIVPDGSLHLVPFAALPLRGAPLAVRAEIAILPSGSLGAHLRSRRLAKPGHKISVVANPAFSTEWAPLPFSLAEAEAIAALAPARTLSGVEATRARVQSAAFQDAGILHFSTHAHVDASNAALSAIALANGEMLRVHDIYAQKLPGSLVILSACETALGRETMGEGPVGLTRAFLYAGANSVAATLWTIQDRASAELMRRFYEGYLKGGLGPAAALRRAQLSLRREPRWAHPYFWASFAVHGDGR